MIEIQVQSLEELQSFADRLIATLPRRATIALVGTLGAGKTTLVQAIARGIGIDATEVTSPTFTLLQSHQGMHPSAGQRMDLHHLDAYRIADEDEFDELGVDELYDQPNAWTVVEWADRVGRSLPDDSLWIELKVSSDANQRTMTLGSDDPQLAKKLELLAR